MAAEKPGQQTAAAGKPKKRDLIHLDDFTKDELMTILDRARDVKQRVKTDREWQPLRGRTMSMIFAKPSLRTRVSFESVRLSCASGRPTLSQLLQNDVLRV